MPSLAAKSQILEQHRHKRKYLIKTSCLSLKILAIAMFVCNLCNDIFTRPSGLRCHLDVKHGNLRRHICGQCGSRFGRRKDLTVHESEQHRSEAERLVSCSACAKVYSRQSSLLRHVRDSLGCREILTPTARDILIGPNVRLAVPKHKKRPATQASDVPPALSADLGNVRSRALAIDLLNIRVQLSEVLLQLDGILVPEIRKQLLEFYGYFLRFTQFYLGAVQTVYYKRTQAAMSIHSLLLLDSSVGFMIMLATILGLKEEDRQHRKTWAHDLFDYRLHLCGKQARFKVTSGRILCVLPGSGLVEHSETKIVDCSYVAQLGEMTRYRNSMSALQETPTDSMVAGRDILRRFVQFARIYRLP